MSNCCSPCTAKGTVYANSLLQLIFNAVDFSDVADATGTDFLYVSLHTAAPDPLANPDGYQSYMEAAYTSYARVEVARDNTGWNVINNQVSPVADIVFPTATGGNEVELYAGVGLDSSGDGVLLYFGPLKPPIGVVTGTTPILSAGSSLTFEF